MEWATRPHPNDCRPDWSGSWLPISQIHGVLTSADTLTMTRSVLSNTPTIMAFASGRELATLKSSLMPIPLISIRYRGASTHPQA